MGSFLRRAGELALRNKAVIIFAVCVIVFIELLEEVLEGDLMKLDVLARAVFVDALRADWLTPTMESFSALATPVSLIVFLVVIAGFAPGRRPGPASRTWTAAATRTRCMPW